jgi:hypothetical protein
MLVTFSNEITGWSELEAFLAGTEKGLTVAMYQFTAPHIFEAVKASAISRPLSFARRFYS